jgi:benzoyl-CoA reductase/2-hydroxyglutaryl-CoA dehydratase subunit BcrC/BadD/HgdB
VILALNKKEKDNMSTQTIDRQGVSSDNLITAEQLAPAIKGAAEAMRNKPGVMKSTAGYMDLVYKYVNRIVTAHDEGKWVTTHGTQQPLEIFEAMDVRGVFIEFWGVITDVVNLNAVPEALSISTSTGTPAEVCSFFKNLDGLMHVGKWPKTDFMLYATSSCDNVKGYYTLGRRYGIPSFGMERPYYPYTSKSLEHWKNEHKRLITFLEEQTGKKMDYDRLKEVVALSYRLTELTLEIDKLVAHVPSPMSAECFGAVLVTIRLLPGTQEAVDYLTALRDELQERIDNGIDAEKEKFRVIWSCFTPFWDPQLLGYMQQKYGAVSVGEVLANWRGKANWLLDPNDPLGNLAYRTQFAPGNCQYASSQDWASNVVDQGRRLKADGAIYNNNWGCKQASALPSIVRDELMRELKVPSVTLNCDVIDHTFVTRAEVESQLDSFFEMIENSTAYKERRNGKMTAAGGI